ncbi:MAG TPA: hypothetical protein VJJ80_01645 [Patescibacteria group bacterium]|nr:hypothetical protein [Patescibacteria group bacterium]
MIWLLFVETPIAWILSGYMLYWVFSSSLPTSERKRLFLTQFLPLFFVHFVAKYIGQTRFYTPLYIEKGPLFSDVMICMLLGWWIYVIAFYWFELKKKSTSTQRDFLQVHALLGFLLAFVGYFGFLFYYHDLYIAIPVFWVYLVFSLMLWIAGEHLDLKLKPKETK